MFIDRSEAGEKLAQRLSSYKNKNVVVLAIPRGGVIVGAKVAAALKAPLDVVIPRKIGAPGNPELAIGAVAGDGQVVLNEEIKRSLSISEEYLKEEIARQVDEINRRRRKYLGGRSPLSVKDKIAIIVDDGLATGSTALAAARAVHQGKPKKVILAVPVAPRDTCLRLESEVDELVCLNAPSLFYAVGQFYADFSQTTDAEVIEVLRKFEKSKQ